MEGGVIDQSTMGGKLSAAFYEALGTFFVFTAVNLTAGAAVPFALFVGIMIAGKTSGAHFNPAVSTGVFVMMGDFGKNIFIYLIYFISQLIGATLSALFCFIILKHVNNGAGPMINNLQPKGDFYLWDSYGRVFLAECICTFLFVLIILIVKNGPKTQHSADGVMAGITIAGALWAGLGWIAHFTGGCMNTAVAIVQPLFFHAYYQNNWREYGFVEQSSSDYLSFMWVYIFATLLGGLLAGLFMNLVHTGVLESAEAAGDKEE